MSSPEHQRILPHFDISEQGLRELEIWLNRRAQELQWGPWIYVGSFPIGEDTTRLSPEFQNGWQNVGGGQQRLRFRRTMPTKNKRVQSLEIEGDISNASVTTNSVIFTLPAGYRPSENSGPVLAANTGGNVVIWEISTNGNVTYVGNGSASGAVSSVFGRVGAVVAATNDYTEAQISFSDITTNNVSTAKHGYAPKNPGDGSKYLDGTGLYSSPSGASPGGGASARLFDFTISGADKASIDSGVDGAFVANFAGYDILEVWILIRTDDVGALDSADLTLNNDTGGNYDRIYIQGFSGSAASGSSLAQSAWRFNAHGSGGTANYPSADVFTFPNYAGTTFYKTGEVREAIPDGTAGNNVVTMWALGYRSTSAISRIKIAAVGGNKFKIGSRMIVYGR